jgi:hypothetical protein
MWLVPLPAWVSVALALLVRDELWREVLLPARGGEMRGVPGYIALVSLVLLTLFYGASLYPRARDFLTPRTGNVSEAELGCALVLTRLVVVTGMYGLALRVWFFGA